MQRFARLHLCVRRTLSVLFVLGIVVSAVPATAVPVRAAPAALLTFVEVAAPDVNCLFDADCTITVDDLADHFVPPAATGDAFLQSRLWPAGEVGTPGQGLYPYLYRIDLTQATGVTAAACVTDMRIEFGPIVPMDYNGDGKPEHAFVVTKGGLGNVKPSHIEQFGSTLLIHFQDPPICVGGQPGGGDTAYFIGFASEQPARDVTADLSGTLGLAETLDARAPRQEQEPRIRIAESTNKLFKAGVELPPGLLLPATGPKEEQFTHFILPYVDPGSSPVGKPDVPILRRLLAIPRGAQVRVAGVAIGQSEHLDGIVLYPSQPQPADPTKETPPGVFEDLPFAFDAEAYRSDKPFPPQVVEVVPMGRLRDLDVVQLNIAAGQYNAAKQTLDIVKAVDFEIVFEGGAEGFLPRQHADNPFDESFDPIYAQVLNAAVLREYPFGEIVARVCWGNELFIITHPDLRAAADDLRTFKVAHGLSTAVYETGNGPGQIGDTKEEIRDFIRDRFDGCLVRPAYVLLLGDAELVPTFYRTTGYGESGGTDLDYSLMDNADILPDLAYGRIPVDTLADAQTVIDKIIAYEGTPPFAGSFYDDVSFAAYFQCCRDEVAQDGTAMRSFIETAEFVRDELDSLGYDVERIYTTSTDYSNDPADDWYYNTALRDPTPNRYYNGTLLPADLRASSGYPWDGDANDVINAINDGRFLVLHRDHGWTSGWADPSFSTTDLGGLTNGDLTPVVYSINCASGMFDNETLNPAQQVYPYSNAAGYVSWAEELLRMEGGAVGIIGDTRVSPTWANSALTRGLFDATWTDVLPAYGGATSIRRLGDILNYGKTYLVGQVGVAQTAGSVSNSDANTDVILYHVLGDPSMRMYTSDPWRIFLPKYWYEIEIPKPWEIWRVHYPVNGVMMTALQEGEPVARGPVVGGVAQLDFIHEVDQNKPIDLSVQHPDGTSIALGGPDTHGRITPQVGGLLAHTGTKFSLSFAPGAVSADTDVIYRIGGTGKTLPAHLLGLRGFQLEAFDDADADGTPAPVLTFTEPYSMVLGYDDAELGTAGAAGALPSAATAAVDEQSLGVHSYDPVDATWKPLSCTVDAAANQVTCQGDHFTEFALTGAPQTATGAPEQQLFLPNLGR